MHKTRGHDEPQERTQVLEDQTFFCNQCDYTCTKKDTLNAHRNRKHKEADIGQIFYCEHCDYSAGTNQYLWRHIRNKHSEMENLQVEMLKCTECNEEFSRQD